MALPATSRAEAPGKAQRTAEFLAEHNRRMDAIGGKRRWECRECGSLIAKYRPPIGLCEEPCRKCKTLNELTTEPITAP